MQRLGLVLALSGTGAPQLLLTGMSWSVQGQLCPGWQCHRAQAALGNCCSRARNTGRTCRHD